MPMRNVVLIGMTGTGKSTVGRLVAEALGWPHVDTDERIEAVTGRTIAELFAERGEAGFRQWEHDVLREVLKEEGQVVSTGGGVVLRSDNVALLRDGQFVVALAAEPETLVRRLQGDASRHRALLAGDVEAQIRKLIRERRGLYDFAHVRIATDNRLPQEVAAEIVHLYRARTNAQVMGGSY